MHILLVDDDSDDQSLFCEALRLVNPALRCDVVNDGDEALLKLSESEILPDLVFLDINMPRMDGRTCLRLIRSHSRTRQLPVVITSTSISKEDEMLFQKWDATFLKKPNQFDELVIQLRRHIVDEFAKVVS